MVVYKKTIKENLKKDVNFVLKKAFPLPYGYVKEKGNVRFIAKRTMAEARSAIGEIDGLNKAGREKLFSEWMTDFEKYNVTFSEYYYQYNFPALSEEEKNLFMPCMTMHKIFRLNEKESVMLVYRNKKRFLEEFSDFIIRKWIYVDNNCTVEALNEILDLGDIIIKPRNGCHGDGVKKFKKGTITAQEIIKLYKWSLVEECITAEKSIAEYHPASLNTIRVVTFGNGKDVIPVWAHFRTGNAGGCVDNTHGGGIGAEIDVETGIICSDGQIEGTHYEFHPYSGKKFEGTQLPCWDKVIETCCNAMRVLPGCRFAGWDVAIRDDCRIEFIEGNDMPDIDSPQSFLGIGMKPFILDSLKKLGIGSSMEELLKVKVIK